MSSTVAVSRPRVLADLVPAVPTATLRDAALITGGAALTGLSAQFAFTTPITPVPFTLQTMSVLIVGAALGTRRAVAAMALYLVAGVAGLPWFSEASSGWHMPSFGYIVGFIFAAGLVGALAKRGADRHVASTIGLMVAGTLVIYAIGTTWLAIDLGLSVGKAFELGVQPFLGPDAIKIAFAAVAFPGAWRLVNTSRT